VQEEVPRSQHPLLRLKRLTSAKVSLKRRQLKKYKNSTVLLA